MFFRLWLVTSCGASSLSRAGLFFYSTLLHTNQVLYPVSIVVLINMLEKRLELVGEEEVNSNVRTLRRLLSLLVGIRYIIAVLTGEAIITAEMVKSKNSTQQAWLDFTQLALYAWLFCEGTAALRDAASLAGDEALLARDELDEDVANKLVFT